jgi:multidrug efflux system outer membrane protein
LQPTVAVPAQFAGAAEAPAVPDVAWWDQFSDPVLSELVRRAALQNRDVKIAMERVRAARAGQTISRSALLPSFGGSAGTLNHRVDGGPDFESENVGLSVAWEIDLAGGLRAGAAAARADTLATEHGARGVLLLVLTDVASHYFTLAGTLRQLDGVRAISAAHDETLRLVIARQRVGLAAPFDVERARSAADSARAAIPPLETLAAVSRHRIAVLLGDQAANAAAVTPWNGVSAVPAVTAGQPAALLERRPDLLASRARLDAANLRRRQARAEWFPNLFMSALFGSENVQFGDVDLDSARFAQTSGLLSMPIFDFGRTRAINEMADAAQHEALLRYEDAILRALEDVENALVALRDERTRAESLGSAAAAADAALGRAQSLYDRGQIDLLPLLDAQRTSLTVRVSADESNTQLRLRSVQLFKALGGGWEGFEPVATEKEEKS